jgi:hypothetical protein
MNADLAQELLNELGSSLEELETQQVALLQFLKDDGIVTDEQFAPYLTQASHASSVKWRAARIRLERLFSTEKQKEEQLAEKEKQAKDAKTKNDEGSEDAAPQGETDVAKAPAESAGAPPVSDKDGKLGERETSESKKLTAKQERNAA